MHAHHTHPQYHPSQKNIPPGQERLSDTVLATAIITLVMLLFIVYMWFTVAHYSHYSPENNPVAGVPTETTAGTGNSNTSSNMPAGNSINNADNPAAPPDPAITPGGKGGGTNASPTNSAPAMTPSTKADTGNGMRDGSN